MSWQHENLRMCLVHTCPSTFPYLCPAHSVCGYRERAQVDRNTLLVSPAHYKPSRGRRYGNGWHLD